MTELAVYETFEEVFGRRSTLDELIVDIGRFSQQSVLWLCATIVTGVQLWDSIDSRPEAYAQFLTLFFDNDLRLRLVAGFWSRPKRIVFHRRQLLLIAKLAILHCSGSGLDARRSARSFGMILLKASDQFHYGLVPAGQTHLASREDYARVVAEMVSVEETASSRIDHLITRSHLMLTRFSHEMRNDPDFVDIAGEHQRATGLTLEEFEAMIFGVHSRFGGDLAKKLKTEPGALPLKESNFADTAIPYDKIRHFLDSVSASPIAMARELGKRDEGANDFTIFRKFPLIQQYYNLHLTSAWFGFLMMDNLFFLEKIQTGPYWRANEFYGLKLRKFWGAVFEKYVNELLKQACVRTDSLFLPDPRPADDPSVQLCDGIIVSGESMVLMEYKSSMFRADTKYGGDPAALAKEIENKLVHDREADERKGVEQLAEAVNRIFQRDSHFEIRGIDRAKVKQVYLYIITLDSIGGTVGISPFLNTYLEDCLKADSYPALAIRPLYCSNIAELEHATEYFGDYTLPQVLELWVKGSPSLTAPLAAVHFGPEKWRGNEWLASEWDSIFRGMTAVLYPGHDPGPGMAAAIQRWRERKRYRP
jgi:hypothetical protein